MREMTPERWRRVSSLLDRGLSLDPDERAAWLESEVLDEDLRAEVAAFLAGAERTSGVLDDGISVYLEIDPIEEDLGVLMPPAVAGTRIGPYEVVSELGRGGMGVVFLAARADGQFENRVALKLVRSEFDGREIVRRFERERRILARLEHPAIARIFDGGVTGDSRPYFAMEFVDGEPLTAYCDARSLSIEDRLRLFVRVCDAVQYAHGRLVVHRDLKPSNILVTDGGELKLVDFGIAKVLSAAQDDEIDLTRPGGLRPFTPAYAAPEQIDGEATTIATDVYALGLVLYELISGRRPFDGMAGSTRDLERAVLETDPPPPSRVCRRTTDLDSEPAAERAAARRVSEGALARRLVGDLDAIVLMALRKEPSRRYASVQALRDDIARHLEHRSIRARRESNLIQAAKFARRHRFGIAVSSLLGLSIAVGVVGTAWQARQKTLQAERARRVTEFVLGLFESADPAKAQGKEITARELVEQGAARLEQELAGQTEVQAEMGLVLGRINDRLGLSEEALVLLDRSLERSTASTGSSARKTRADALRAKGAVLTHLGRAAEAEPVLREAMAEHRSQVGAGGDADLNVAEDLDELSIALRALGRLEETERAVRDAFELRLSVLGPDHLRIAVSYNNMAVTQRELGKLDEAEANYKKALAIRIPNLGSEHPETADSLNNLAALLNHRGRYAESVAAFEEVSGIYGRLYGDRHPRTITAANNLAVALLKLGDLDRAEGLFESVLSYWRETASDQHPNALMTLGNLGLLYQMRGEVQRARRTYESVVEGMTSALGEDHPVTAIFSLRLASTERELGRNPRARELAIPGVAVLEKVYGPEHQHVAAGLEELGRIECNLGECGPGRQALRRAAAIRAGDTGPEALETLRVQTAMGACLRSCGDLVASEDLLTKVLEVGRRVLPATHAFLSDLQLELGLTLAAAGRAADAEPLLAAAAEVAIEALGTENWRTAMAELRLMELQQTLGGVDLAPNSVDGVELTLRSELGPEHPLTRDARRLKQSLAP